MAGIGGGFGFGHSSPVTNDGKQNYTSQTGNTYSGDQVDYADGSVGDHVTQSGCSCEEVCATGLVNSIVNEKGNGEELQAGGTGNNVTLNIAAGPNSDTSVATPSTLQGNDNTVDFYDTGAGSLQLNGNGNQVKTNGNTNQIGQPFGLNADNSSFNLHGNNNSVNDNYSQAGSKAPTLANSSMDIEGNNNTVNLNQPLKDAKVKITGDGIQANYREGPDGKPGWTATQNGHPIGVHVDEKTGETTFGGPPPPPPPKPKPPSDKTIQ